jgi:hypothetical protein
MLRKKKIDWKDEGEIAAAHIKLAAAKLCEQIYENDKEIVKDQIACLEILTFASALYFIVADREAFNYLNEKERSVFDNTILNEIVTGLSDLWTEPDKIRPTVGGQLNKYIAKLAPFSERLYAEEKGGNPKGTLYWEFSKILDKEHGVETVAALSANWQATIIGTDVRVELQKLLPKK